MQLGKKARKKIKKIKNEKENRRENAELSGNGPTRMNKNAIKSGNHDPSQKPQGCGNGPDFRVTLSRFLPNEQMPIPGGIGK